MIANAKLLTEGCRFRILSEHDNDSILAAGHWHLVWALKFGKAQVRAKVGPSKKDAEWLALDNAEGLRIQTQGTNGWR